MSWYRNLVFGIKGFREYTRSGYQSAAAQFDPEELKNVRLDNRVALVTGANSGIGFVCSKALAQRGAEVHLVCRDAGRARAALEQIQTETGGDSTRGIFVHQLDLSKPKNVGEFGKYFAEHFPKLDILINSAGCMINTLTVNENNIETNFATNTLGTYILTEYLIPCLEKSDDPRVITVSSGGMLVQRLDADDPMLEFQRTGAFDGTMVYAQNKRQQVVLTEIWAKAHPSIRFFSMHPGWADTPAVLSSMPNFHARMQGRLRTPEEGADTAVWLALTPNIKEYENGAFFQDKMPSQANELHLPEAKWFSCASHSPSPLLLLVEAVPPGSGSHSCKPEAGLGC